MYKLIVQATTMNEMRNKLFEAANSIVETHTLHSKDIPQIQHQAVDWDLVEQKLKDRRDQLIQDAHSTGPAIFDEAPNVDRIIKEEAHRMMNAPVPFPEHTVFPAIVDLGLQPGPVDSRGVPWDERIHSTSKALNKDGSWRIRRGADDNQVRQIEASLARRQTTPIAAALPSIEREVPVASAPPIPAPPTTTLNVAPVFTQPAPFAPSEPVVSAPSYENISVPPTTKPAHTLETFKANFIQVLGGLAQSGKIDQAYIEAMKKHHGVKEIWHVANDDGMLRELFENFVSFGLITKVG